MLTINKNYFKTHPSSPKPPESYFQLGSTLQSFEFSIASRLASLFSNFVKFLKLSWDPKQNFKTVNVSAVGALPESRQICTSGFLSFALLLCTMTDNLGILPSKLQHSQTESDGKYLFLAVLPIMTYGPLTQKRCSSPLNLDQMKSYWTMAPFGKTIAAHFCVVMTLFTVINTLHISNLTDSGTLKALRCGI